MFARLGVAGSLGALAGATIPSWISRDSSGAPALLDADIANNRFWYSGHIRSSFATLCAAAGIAPQGSGASVYILGANGLPELCAAKGDRIVRDSTGARIGLQPFNQIQNLLSWSDDQSNIAWAKTNLTGAANQASGISAPGAASALIETAVAATHLSNRPLVPVAGSYYIWSAGLSAGGRRYIMLAAAGAGMTGTFTVVLDTQTGLIFTASGSTAAIRSGVVAYSNGCFRVWMEFLTVSTAQLNVSIYGMSGPTYAERSYTGVAGTIAAYVSGAQLTLGRTLGPVVPTTSAAATSADLYYQMPVSLSQGWSIIATAQSEEIPNAAPGDGYIAAIDTAGNDQLALRLISTTGNQPSYVVGDGTANTTVNAGTSVARLTDATIAWGVSPLADPGQGMSVGGSAIAAPAVQIGAATPSATLSLFGAGAASTINGLVKRFAIFTKRLSSVELADGFTPALKKLKAVLALGQPQQIMASDPITVGAYTGTSSLASPVTILNTDSRLRLLGGKWVVGNFGLMYPQGITNGDPSIISGSTGLPQNRRGSNNSIDFVLPAGQAQVELHLFGVGSQSPLIVEVDGVATNSAGYTLGPVNSGQNQYTLITFPSSGSDRHIRLWFGNRPLADLRLPTGNTIKAYTPPLPYNMVVTGDSIGDGTAASTIANEFVSQVAYRSGIDNLISSSVPGSGYLQRVPYTAAVINTTSGSSSVAVVSGTLALGSLVQAAGVPYGTTVTTAASAGGTAVLSAVATATASSVAAKIATGYNALDRVNYDVLTAYNGGPPDGLMVPLGLNDFGVAPGGNQTVADTGAQALAYFQALRAGAPAMPIFVIGPFTDYANYVYSATSYAGRDAIFASAAQVPRCYPVDVSDMVTLANRDIIFGAGGPFTPHPIDAGHFIYGQVIGARMAAIINGF